MSDFVVLRNAIVRILFALETHRDSSINRYRIKYTFVC